MLESGKPVKIINDGSSISFKDEVDASLGISGTAVLPIGEGDVTNLVTDLGNKAASTHNHSLAGLTEKSYTSLTDKPTVATLPITEADVTNLVTDLGNKAASSHSHAPSDVTGTAVVTNDSRLSDTRDPKSHGNSAHSSNFIVQSDAVVPNTAITAATKTKISYDVKGLVTTGADATTADIVDSTDKRYVTDAQLVVVGNTSGTNSGNQIVPANEAGSTNNFLSAYNSSNGAWTKARPTWANVDKATSSIADITTKSHTALTDIGTNAHATIDTFIGTKAAASGLASLDSSSKLVQARARADNGLGYVQLANDTLPQAYATNNATKLTVTANRTLTTTVPPAGCEAFTMILTASASSWVITFGTGFKPTGTLTTGTTTARIFVIHWISDGTNLYEAGRTGAMVA